MADRLKAAILGAADGVTSISGVVAGGAAAGVSHVALGVTAIGGALAATVSMAGAEMLSEDATDWGAIWAMAVGTLAGAGLPDLPLLFAGGLVAWLIVLALCAVVTAAVGEIRHRSSGRSRPNAYLMTLLVLGLGAGVGWAAGKVGTDLAPGLST